MVQVPVNRIYSFLGLAAKAGRLLSGDDTCDRALKSGKVHLLIVAEDASELTRKTFDDACRFRQVDIRFFGQKQELGRSIGKEVRAVIAVRDAGFAGRLKEMIDSIGLEHGGV